MVFLDRAEIVRESTVEPIIGFEVEFMTPFGLARTLTEAQDACRARDLDPAICVVPVPVAHSATLREVVRR